MTPLGFNLVTADYRVTAELWLDDDYCTAEWWVKQWYPGLQGAERDSCYVLADSEKEAIERGKVIFAQRANDSYGTTR
jgi:hypothetical protein